jgi:hypothetical protein
MDKTMKAMVLTRFCGPEVFELQELPVPVPRAATGVGTRAGHGDRGLTIRGKVAIKVAH